MSNIVRDTNFPNLKLFNKGKVRDIYDLGDYLLIVTTDRISAFDVILPEGIPFKGTVLNQMSIYWFKIMESIIPNHLVSHDVDEFPESCKPYAAELKDRSMLVKKAKPLPVECVVRGYIAGSMWKEYQLRIENDELDNNKTTIEACGVELPTGLEESSRLESLVFSPATKAELGDHDINISFKKSEEILGAALAAQVRDVSTQIYKKAVELAEKKGIIIADTKFEFGVWNGELILIDEILSPDSSRFWPLKGYKPGTSQPSFDKQFVRDYLISRKWDQCSTPPALPEEIITQTSEKYLQAYEILTGKKRNESGM
ncbi:MAG: phosphoribosylaminoimidazolesuccinocarboxamide synthase [Candidatus Anammoxibacter sp.]